MNISDINNAAQFSQPQSFVEWTNDNNITPESRGYGLGQRILNFFTGNADAVRDRYQNYLDINQRQFQIDSVMNARRWEEYMQNTTYQRLVKDLKAAGLNPGLVLSSSVGPAGAPVSPSGFSNSKLRSPSSDLASDTGAGLAKFASAALAVVGMIASKGMTAAQMGARTAAIAANNARSVGQREKEFEWKRWNMFHDNWEDRSYFDKDNNEWVKTHYHIF